MPAGQQQAPKLFITGCRPGKKHGRARNAPKVDLRERMFHMCGVDFTRIDGVDVTTALLMLSEIGTYMSRFATVTHFTYWLGLCPGTKITAGRQLNGKTKRCANHAAQALCLAAIAMHSSKSALGSHFRRSYSRMDKPRAVTPYYAQTGSADLCHAHHRRAEHRPRPR